MFFINLKIAFRSLFRSKTYTFLSITSLVMGFIGFIFMLLYTNYEKSYEKWIPGNSSVYRIDQKQGVNSLSINTPGPLANAVQNELPEIEYATGLQKFNVSLPFYSGINNSFTFKNLYGVDSSFLKIFPLKLKYGSFKDFYSPQTIILSEKVSEKLFGNANPVGKTISMGYNLGMDFTIAGVLKNPAPTHLDLEAISWYPQSSVPAWNTGYEMPYTTYVKVKKNVSIAALDKKIENLYRKNLKQSNSELNITLEPINQIHLNSLISGDGNFKLLIAIVLLAGLLLAISCLNFINLVIAKSSTRNKEIAIKKVLGTGRISLIKQFISETFLQTFISFLIASGLLFLLMPYLKNMVGIQNNLLSSFTISKLTVELIASVLIISLITGLYPALIISGKKVSAFLKGSSSGEKGKSGFRSVLLVIQFTIAISFIFSLVFINKQIHYMQNKNLGFDPYKVLNISTMNFYATPDVFDHDKIRLLEIPNVESATVTSDVPGEKLKGSVSINVNGNQFHLKSMTVDYDYFKTLDIPLAEGRDFSKAYVGDSTRSVILNQSAVQEMHLNLPVGKIVKLNDSANYTIIGVCKDYFNNGFSENIPPVAYTMTNPIGKTERPNILLKVGTGNIMTTVEKLKTLWTSVSPMDPQLRFSFLDEDYQKLFVQSERLSNVLKIVSYLSLLISLMGLFGLSSYILSQRRKELSIRKVIGASVFDIFLLVNKNFVRLILLSTLFAFTLSYFFIKNWLTNYAYQTSIDFGIFVLILLIIVVLTVITVTLQSYKTLRENPINNLKSE